MQRWFITGISRGFGKVLAQELLAQGHTVVGTTRSGTADFAHQRLHVLPLDVTDEAQVSAIVAKAAQWLGTIDVVVNNAGFGIVGAVEEIRSDEARKVFETNFFGTLHVTRAALPYLRNQKHGKIINFSSVAGFVGGASFGMYNASKFAVEGLSEALSMELKPLGIDVMIVEPGAFRTEFRSPQSIMYAKDIIDDYAASSGQTRAWIAKEQATQPGDPVLAVKAIIEVASRKHPPLRLPLGSDCIDRMRKKLATVEAEIASVEPMARSTSYVR